MTPARSDSVQKTIVVEAGLDRAFKVFTAGIDSWWPRTHHIGKSPMKQCIIEGRVGGRCHTLQQDGTDCDWGEVLSWEPPHRFVMAWKITHEWGYEHDPSKASEVEVLFTDLGNGKTRIDLEHRHFGRMGPFGEIMRTAVSSPGGWGTLLGMFAAHVAGSTPA